MKHEDLAKQIIMAVGGEENVSSLTHCMTRLRFNLIDDSKASVEDVKKIKGVTGAVKQGQGGQFQIIIGTHVDEVYSAIMNTAKIKNNSTESDQRAPKKGVFASVVDVISGVFTPIVGAIAGAAMVKAILAVLTTFEIISKSSQTYILLNMISDGVFFFMPFFLAITAAMKFKANQFVSLVFAAMLVHPTYTAMVAAGEPVSFIGIPLKLATYSSSVIPIVLIVWFQSYVEKFANKVSPKAIKVFFAPLLVILITAPIGLIVIGPIGTFLGDYLGQFFMFLDKQGSWIMPTIVGAFWPLMVMTGVHYGVAPLQGVQRATLGYATIITPGAIISNMSQAGASFAVSLRAKNKEMRSLASSTAVTALCGITEPALYGVTLKLKRPLIGAIIAGGISGFFCGIMNVKAWGSGSSSIFSLPIFIGEDRSFVNAIIMIAMALVLSFVITFIIYKEPVEASEPISTTTDINGTIEQYAAAKEGTNGRIVAYPPLQGELVSLDRVDDEAFRDRSMGKGVAIIPKNDVVVSPVNGVVQVISSTKHAIGILSDDGAEILIHVGINTVKLAGKHFEPLVKRGDKVTLNMPLIKFNREAIEQAGYQTITPVIVANSSEFLDVIETDKGNTDINTPILTIIK